MKYVISEYTVRLNPMHGVTVPALRRLRCMKCKGEFFDAEAMAVKSHYLRNDPVWRERRRALFQKVALRRKTTAQAA
ncbi:MAG: hypothetical protein HYT87_03680 [Nitrospirae bacterium]|nr:hypothetical protein [Nitrospirota bacterium]